MSLIKQLSDRFKTHEGQWISGGSVEKWVTTETEYTASNARRRLRELVEDKILKQKEEVRNGTNHAYYMYDPTETSEPPKPVYKYEFDEERQCMVEVLVK